MKKRSKGNGTRHQSDAKDRPQDTSAAEAQQEHGITAPSKEQTEEMSHSPEERTQELRDFILESDANPFVEHHNSKHLVEEAISDCNLLKEHLQNSIR